MGNWPQTQKFWIFQKWATDPKWAQIWGGALLHPHFFEFWARGNCPSTDQTPAYTTDRVTLVMFLDSKKCVSCRLLDVSPQQIMWQEHGWRASRDETREGKVSIAVAKHVVALCELWAYEGCTESIRPFWISREPFAWPWCNLLVRGDLTVRLWTVTLLWG